MTRTNVTVMLLLAIGTTSVDAQADPGSPLEDRIVQLVGFSAGYLYHGELNLGLPLIGFNVTGIQSSGAGSAFSLQIAPHFLAEGKPPVVWTEISFLRAQPIDRGWFTIKAGATGVVVLTGESGAMRPGLHVGAGSVARVTERTGMRVDIAPHFMWGLPVDQPVVNASLGLTFFPARR